jgi:thioester reductase-like protein
MATTLVTGFPGFLGSELVRRVLARGEGDVVCLVQARFAGLARSRAEELDPGVDGPARRLRLVEGDITRPRLGLDADDAAALRRQVTEVHHLAAVYDLAVTRELGMRVNVEGTRNLLELAASCDGLRRLHYVSTCYVSGRHPGIYSEDQLDTGQTFNNHYEETKFLAEVEVRERMRAGMPATVYRPAIVVGDSRTGATQKYDGPYYILKLLLLQPRGLAAIPVMGDPASICFNMVPRDVVVDAITHLSGLEASLGRVYQLADPAPPTVREMLREMARATGRRLVRVHLPRRLVRGSVRALEPVLHIPAVATDYFVHPAHYSTVHARADLAGSGIAVPRFASYVDTLVAFMRAHPEIGSAAMV